jgi:hypothetical protein
MYPQAPASKRDNAETLAIQGLGFLAADMERLEPFLSLTGLQPANLRAAAAGPGFLAGVLDYLASNEKLLLLFAAEFGVDPASVVRARDTLGGPPPEWGT